MALKCENINLSYKENGKEKIILKDLEFELADKGEIKLVYGHIGVGKSTLIYTLAGLLDNFMGTVNWDDFSFTKANHEVDTSRNEYMSINFSNFFYIKDMSVEENILFPATFTRRLKQPYNNEYKNNTIEKTKQRLEKIYKAFDNIDLVHGESKKNKNAQDTEDNSVFSLEKFKNKKIGTLSNGQREIVMLARMLINDAKYILADETLRSFNTGVKEKMLDILFNEFYLGVNNSMLLITHDDDMLWRMEKYYHKDQTTIKAYKFEDKKLREFTKNEYEVARKRKEIVDLEEKLNKKDQE
jgi:ABC-type lipoprotein export system ATPase subunit